MLATARIAVSVWLRELEEACQEAHEIGPGDALLVVGPAITPMTLAAGPL